MVSQRVRQLGDWTTTRWKSLDPQIITWRRAVHWQRSSTWLVTWVKINKYLEFKIKFLRLVRDRNQSFLKLCCSTSRVVNKSTHKRKKWCESFLIYFSVYSRGIVINFGTWNKRLLLCLREKYKFSISIYSAKKIKCRQTRPHLNWFSLLKRLVVSPLGK